MKPLDIPVIIFATALTVFIAFLAFAGNAASSQVIIKGPDKTWIFPLDAEERVTVTGPIGVTVVELHAGKAAIVSSPCSGQTCVAAAAVNKSGQWAACLPNRVFLLVESAKGQDTIDAAAW